MSAWLSLQEYSYQKGISVSTLRRKIKNEELEYRLENGRYFLNADPQKEKGSYQKAKEKSFFQKELEKKEQELLSLKHEYEDLMILVHYLETEKQELLKYIENEQVRTL